MAGFRFPGPLGSYLTPLSDAGTLCRTLAPSPGPLGGFSPVPPLRTANQCYASPYLLRPLRLDRAAFIRQFEAEQPRPFGTLDEEQRGGLNQVLDFIETDAELLDVRHVAYMLATLMHESRKAPKWKLRWQPEHESGYANQPYGKPVEITDWAGRPLGPDYKVAQGPLDKQGKRQPPPASAKAAPQVFYGRGYVQLTWQDNYRAMDEALGLRGALHLNPDLAADADDPSVAYRIMSYGMRMGSFYGSGRKHVQGAGFVGGHRLADYIAGERCDYYNARDIIIGGHDKATEIADYAAKLERILQCSRLE